MEGARIGPNALTQMIAPIETRFGRADLEALLARAGIAAMPDMAGLIDEDPVIRLHGGVKDAHPEDARAIAREAGVGTARYILAHRIPQAAQDVLRILPVWLSSRLLARAIRANAWTFAGSGSFAVVSMRPLVFEIARNPLAIPGPGAEAGCDWHVAVFETLFRKLVSPGAQVRETACCAAGAPACRFEIALGRRPMANRA